jgi:NitT/TauT family transport system substrate-binding protein
MPERPSPLLRLTFGLLCFALALCAACSRESPAPAPAGSGSARAAAATPVKLALNWVPEPEFGGFYAAREAGLYKAAGLEVEILGGGAGVPVVQMVATGQVAFGVVGADDVITARARGADVVPLFATFQTSPQGLMAHASRGAKSIADLLSSGTVALEPGLPYAAYLKKKHGFDRVKIVPYDGGVARFLADKDFAQQCFVTAEPLAAKKQGGDPQVFLVADEGYNPYLGVLVARRALWNEKPDLVRAFIKASREGWEAYVKDPSRANAVMGALNKTMDAETMKAAAAAQEPLLQGEATRAGGFGAMTRARWETLGQQLADLGIVEKAPPLDYLVTMP